MTSPLNSLRRDLDRIGGPRALSTSVIMVSVTAMFMITLVLDMIIGGGSPLLWILACAVSMAASVAFLLLARMTVLPIHPRAPRPWIALAVFGLAGAIRFQTLTALAREMGLPPIINKSTLLAAAMMMIMMSLATLTATRVDEHRDTLKDLTAERARLVALGATFEERVAESERRLQAEIHAKLDPAMDEIDSMLGDESSPVTVEVLSQAVSDIVRPMSQQLGASPTTAAAALEEAISAPYEIATSVHKANIKDALRPGMTSLLCALLTIAWFNPTIPSISLFLGLITVGGLLCWVVGSVIRALWPSRVTVRLVIPALVTVLALNSATGLTMSVVALGLPNLFFGGRRAGASITEAQNAAWVGLAAAVIGFAISALVLTQRRLENVEEDLRDVNTRLSIAVSQLRGQLWVNRRNLSWILHGPVQSALVSAALEMSDPALDSDGRSRVRQRIRQAIATIDSTSRREARLEHAVAEIASVWDFSCEVEAHIEPALAERLEQDSTTSSEVIEIVREGVGNAVRHGSATRVDIDISLVSDTFAHVRIRDNGTGIDTDSGRGLGSAMLDEVAYHWERRGSEEGTLLVADIPLQK